MPKKLKLDLKGLKVQSFVTSLDGNEKKNIHGGATAEYTPCVSECDTCDMTCPTYDVTCAATCGQTCATCTCYTEYCGTCGTCAGKACGTPVSECITCP